MNFRICALLLMVAAGLSGCQSHKAKNFRAAIIGCEETAFYILVGNDELGKRKNELISKRKFKDALIIARKQDSIYQMMLSQIKVLPESNLNYSRELKQVALNYYQSIGELIKINNKELEWQYLHIEAPHGSADSSDNLLDLNNRGLKQDSDIIKKKDLLDKAIKQFDQANNL